MAAVPKMKPFHTLRVSSLVYLNRAHAILYSMAILALLYHRSVSLFSSTTLLSCCLSLSLLVSDVVLGFMWITTQALRWRPVRRTEFPERLAESVGPNELPALDVFICTCDPRKEPPMSVVSTALSVMAFDYPTDRLSVYVSDDGGSAVTLFAFMEAAKFARYWLPFCKENGLLERSPEAFFRSGNGLKSEKMKIMYQNMKERVEDALDRGHVDNELVSSEDAEVFKKWSKGFTRHDHPSVVQVLLEASKDSDIMGRALPNLIYVSREKRPTSPHHYKAGALNVLTRVSSAMTNAAVILTLDCDMYSNDPQSPLRALCYLLDPAMSSDLAFVQFPQSFRGINRDDIYACELKRLFRINARGMDGLRGTNYVGTGCYFSRRALISHDPTSMATLASSTLDQSSFAELSLRRAHEVASSTYELDTKWGSMIGFRYGSLVEDYYTGYHLHCEGWRSVFCEPDRSAFLGDVPQSLNDVLSQCKRWCVGLFEVGFSRHSPLTFGAMKTSLLTGLAYAHYAFWGTWCIPITIYGLLPPLALAHQVPLFPKVSTPWFFLYAYLFFAAYGQDLVDFLLSDGTIQRWWSDQRMWMIKGFTSYLFATAQFALKQMGVSAPGFDVTSKVTEDERNKRYERGDFDFGVESPFFVALGAAAVVNLSSFLVGVVRAARMEEEDEGSLDAMFAQLFISGFVVVNCWPVYEAMLVRKDGGRMQRNVTFLSFLLAALFHCIGYFIF